MRRGGASRRIPPDPAASLESASEPRRTPFGVPVVNRGLDQGPPDGCLRPTLDVDFPMITMCSYCQRVRVAEAPSHWITVADYLDRGEPAEVRVSHGICPRCLMTIALPSMAVNIEDI